MNALTASLFSSAVGDLPGFSALAALAGLDAAPTNTNITTAGNGTLTAAAIVGGLITRTGPTGAYTDTTDTAAAIVAAAGGVFTSGQIITFTVKNSVGFTQTINGGTGVTMPANNIVGPLQEATFEATVGGTAAAPTLTVTHVGTTSISMAPSVTAPVSTALNTVGAGTITAAGINGGITARGGSQANAAFTDTTDTAANIVAGNPALIGKVGASFLYAYQNTTNANATLQGGTGVTVSGVTVVPGNCTALFLVTQTAANTITMVGLLVTHPSAPNGTFVANGATAVVVADTRLTANSVIVFTMKTVGGTPAGAPFLSAATPGTGFSVKAAAGDTSTYNYIILN